MYAVAGHLLIEDRKAIARPEIDHILHTIPVGIRIIIDTKLHILSIGSEVEIVVFADLAFFAYFSSQVIAIVQAVIAYEFQPLVTFVQEGADRSGNIRAYTQAIMLIVYLVRAYAFELFRRNFFDFILFSKRIHRF